jgi:hypothetical protein
MDGWGITVATAKDTYALYLEQLLTPVNEYNEPIPMDINIELVADNPGEIRCFWENPNSVEHNHYDPECEVDEVNGYCVELFHRTEAEAKADPTGQTGFEKVGFLKWNADELNKDNYKITSDNIDVLANDFVLAEDEVVYLNKHPGTELDIPDPNKTEFWFTPKYFKIRKFGEEDSKIMPGDEYQFVIYPYNVYSTYLDESGRPQPSAYLTNEGSQSERKKISKGIVRVKTADSWVEGQVWVMTVNGWKQAEAVYAKTENGWKEAQ